MDPDKLLADMREAQEEASRNSAVYDDEMRSRYHQAHEKVAYCAEELDEWLSKGGYLPDAWRLAGRR